MTKQASFLAALYYCICQWYCSWRIYLKLAGTWIAATVFVSIHWTSHTLIPRRIRQVLKAVHGQTTSEERKIPLRRISLPPLSLILLHSVALLAALVIIAINLGGVWVGKELTGPIGENGEKQLALQLTAKLHELLVFASLADILWSIVLKSVALGGGIPFGALTAGLRFSDLSYLWSKEFLAVCTTRFTRKRLFLPLLVVSTLLGVTLGPSSATAMTPKLDAWRVGNLNFAMNTSSSELWSTSLELSDVTDTCTSSTQTCGDPRTWSILESNLFAYWGHKSLGGMYAMPETAQIPGEASTRTLNVRFKGPLNLYQPDLTVATIQSAVIADVVNTFRWIWFRANSNRCTASRSKGICSYQDITWSIPAHQPVVYTLCQSIQDQKSPMFPKLDPNDDKEQIAESVNIEHEAANPENSRLSWTNLDSSRPSPASVGVVVSLPPDLSSGISGRYACTVRAQWANANAQSTFLGATYAIDGTPSDYYAPFLPGSSYSGRLVQISPGWAAQSNVDLIINGTMTTSFDQLMRAGGATPKEYVAGKIEAVLSVLLVERMAQVRSESKLLGTLESWDSLLQPRGNALNYEGRTDPHDEYRFQTTVTGYSYGMYPNASLSVSTLLSIMILLTYAVIASFYLVSVLFFEQHRVETWRDVKNLIGLALNSTNPGLENTSTGIESISTLQLPLRLAIRNGHVCMVFGVEQCAKVLGTERITSDSAYA